MESTNAEPKSEGVATRRPLFWWPLTLFALTVTLLFVAGRVSAWYGGEDDPASRWRAHADRMLDRILSEIDASEDQATRIRVIADETLELVTASHAEGREDADALRTLITADPSDRAALEAFRSEHLARADALSEAVVTQLARVLEVLTPEQRQKLVDQLDELRAHHHAHGPDAGRHGTHGFLDFFRSSGGRVAHIRAPRDASGV